MVGEYELRVFVRLCALARLFVRVSDCVRLCVYVCMCVRVRTCLFSLLFAGLHFSEHCAVPGQVFLLWSCESISHTRDYDATQVFKRGEVF